MGAPKREASLRRLISALPFASAGRRRLADTSHLERPILIATVDAEESFDWNRPLSRSNHGVLAMRHQHRMHRIFARYGMVPIYLVDFPVASQEDGRAPLREFLTDKQCEIGAQLHPWVTPPHAEQISASNSFAGNLPPALEREKLKALTDELSTAFGVAPRVYRAGRYGFGVHTARHIKELGYLADSSVVPRWSFAAEGGPDYRRFPADPFWIDAEESLLELPITAGMVGQAARFDRDFYSSLFGSVAERLRLPAVLSRLSLLERIKLTPEGIAIGEAKRLVRYMAAHGQRVFVVTYHSPSLEPGNTPYVRNGDDLSRFVGWMDEFLDFFTSEIGGRCGRWSDVYESTQARRAF